MAGLELDLFFHVHVPERCAVCGHGANNEDVLIALSLPPGFNETMIAVAWMHRGHIN